MDRLPPFAFLLCAAALTSCGAEPRDEGGPPLAAADSTDEALDYVELGDFEAMRARGRLRFANVAVAQLDAFPRLRWGMPSGDQLARQFTDRVGLDLVIEQFTTEDEAQRALLEGRVEGIVGRSGPGIEPLPSGIAASTPFTAMPGVLVGRTGNVPATIEELAGRRVTFAPRSSLIGFADALAAASPGVTIDTAAIATVEDAIDAVLAGRLDLTLTERWVARTVADVHPELDVGAEFGEVLYTAAVRETAPDLLRLVNDFAFDVQRAGDAAAERRVDLAEIVESGVLRVLTVNGPSSYFVYKGDLVGFDFELVRLFADEHDVIVQMVVVPSVELLEPWLERGVGDMIGAGILPGTLAEPEAARLTAEYHDVYPIIVARSSLGVDPAIGYDGLSAVVGRSSPYLPVVRELADSMGYDLTVTTDAVSTRQLLETLDRGEFDATVLESHLAHGDLQDFPGLEIVDSLPETPGRSWAVRADQPELLAALNSFIRGQVGGLTHAVLVRKYFLPETRRAEQPDLLPDGSLSPWDEPVQRHAATAELDWRLLTAQMFQESRFDPQARSHAGAIGLMQMMPATARQLGVENLEDPEEQIRAGVEYMDWLYDRFPSELLFTDRMAFALAAYNAGYGHVSDARRVAEQQGRDPNRWFESVEVAMLSLSDPKVYNATRHGYVRGAEPVRYVRRINELAQMYYRLAPTTPSGPDR
jgi:membrane-bound lytic murein transglycosylase F